MSNNSYKFSGKYIIKGDMRCITGLHIGGTDEGFEIGGMENAVIKDPITGYPYIPGSSLKGKIRSLLEWITKRANNLTCTEYQIDEFETKRKALIDKISGENNPGKKNKLQEELGRMSPSIKPCDCGTCDVCIVFGCSAASAVKEPTRLTVRDSFPKKDTVERWEINLGEKIYTEIKTENTIDRLTSEANPRPMERVTADSVFEVEMLFDIYKEDDEQKIKKVFEGLMLLGDSALGGSGSRGSGKVVFENIKIYKRELAYYIQGTDETKVDQGGNETPRDIHKNFNTIFQIKA